MRRDVPRCQSSHVPILGYIWSSVAFGVVRTGRCERELSMLHRAVLSKGANTRNAEGRLCRRLGAKCFSFASMPRTRLGNQWLSLTFD